MPNHCFNRVEFYSNDKEEEIKKLHDIFSIDVEAEDEATALKIAEIKAPRGAKKFKIVE